MRHETFDIGEFRSTLSGFEATARYRGGSKRALDLVLTVAAAPLWVPLVAVLWCLVRLDGAPGFFGHRRIGQDGRPFTCWKVRTMVPDARAALQAHLAANPEAMREWQSCYKLRRDPRVTWLGGFLRRSSLDELPQLWNVIRGDMSLVGPRPVTPEELAEYRGYERAYTICRPGLTGMWQVSGRNDVSYRQRVLLDLRYARRANLWLDIAILFRTVGVVCRLTGR